MLLTILQLIQCLQIDLGEEPNPNRCDELLLAKGTHQRRHLNNRSLYQHLRGTQELLVAWKQPQWITSAGLFHSIYFDDVLTPQASRTADRRLLRSAIGTKAEALVYLLSKIPGRELAKFNHCPIMTAKGKSDLSTDLNTETYRDLMLLVIASEAEQMTPLGARPGVGLARISSYAETLRRLPRDPPPFLKDFTSVSVDDEAVLLDSYMSGLNFIGLDPSNALSHFERCTEICSSLFEPWLWRSYCAVLRKRYDLAAELATNAVDRLNSWACVWDRRLTREEWRLVAERIMANPRDSSATNILATIFRLLDVASGPSVVPTRSVTIRMNWLTEAEGVNLLAYLQYLADDAEPTVAQHYPTVKQRLRYDAASFYLVEALQRQHRKLREEVPNLSQSLFGLATAPVEIAGNLSTILFYDWGLKHLAAFSACPLIGTIIDSFPEVVRGIYGQAFLARLRPRTYAAPHQIPTNMQVRCVYPIIVPDGPSGIHVEGATFSFVEGEAIIFDSSLRHEEWNDSDGECVLLVVDLWHPDISPSERKVLEAMRRSIEFEAERVKRHWGRSSSSGFHIENAALGSTE